jgi:predicted enzyme related to lactoylglutathione lyase
MSTEHRLSEIRQIAITVSDVSTALPFYRDVLGLTFLFSPTPTLAFLTAGTVRIMLSTPQGAGTVGHNSILYFKVADIVSTHATIIGRGATNERAPQLAAKTPDHELWTELARNLKPLGKRAIACNTLSERRVAFGGRNLDETPASLLPRLLLFLLSGGLPDSPKCMEGFGDSGGRCFGRGGKEGRAALHLRAQPGPRLAHQPGVARTCAETKPVERAMCGVHDDL